MQCRVAIRSALKCALVIGVVVLAACETTQTVTEPWSLRNARVAVPRSDATKRLTFFVREMAAERHADLLKLAPNVDVVTGLSHEEALRRAAEAAGADAWYATSEFLMAAPNLRWVSARSAGVERFLSVPELMQRDDVVLTNMRGAHGPAIADHVFAMLLALTRDMPAAVSNRATKEWRREGPNGLPRIALAGRTLLVVGLGGIGTEIARRGHGFGMRVIATRRSDDGAPAFVEYVGKPVELQTLLGKADVVALAVPLTPETNGLFNQAMFDSMKQGSYLINVARGQVVDTDALLDALRSGRLAGAGLDVTDPEPLPSDHPLWVFPNVIITPHVAADAEITQERTWAVMRENVRRFGAGEPLVNVVDNRLGY